jgi:hypothetical protein
MFMGTILINKCCYLTIIGIHKVPQISPSADKASSKTRHAFPLQPNSTSIKLFCPENSSYGVAMETTA